MKAICGTVKQRDLLCYRKSISDVNPFRFLDFCDKETLGPISYPNYLFFFSNALEKFFNSLCTFQNQRE